MFRLGLLALSLFVCGCAARNHSHAANDSSPMVPVLSRHREIPPNSWESIWLVEAQKGYCSLAAIQGAFDGGGDGVQVVKTVRAYGDRPDEDWWRLEVVHGDHPPGYSAHVRAFCMVREGTILAEQKSECYSAPLAPIGGLRGRCPA